MNRFIILLFCLFLSVSQIGNVKAQEFQPHGLSEIPVLHEGRVKPLGTLARYLRKNLNGSEKGAEKFLAESLFNPAYAENLAVIKVSNPEIVSLLSLPVKPEKRYSYNQLSKALRAQRELILSLADLEPKEWTPAQKALMELQDKTFAYGDLLSALTLYLPLSVQLPMDGLPPELKPLAERDITFAEAKSFESFLRRYLEEVLERNGEDVTKYTETEQAVAYLSFSLMNLSQTGQKSSIFKVMPLKNEAAKNAQKLDWVSPWRYMFVSEHIEDGMEALELSKISALWQELALSYHKGDQTRWNHKVAELQNAYADITPRYNLIALEHQYNSIDPFYVSCLLYIISMIFIICASLGILPRGSIAASLGCILAGLFVHGGGVLARIMILGRPPVSTLYESIVFVGFVCVLYAFFMFAVRRQKIWLLMGALLGIIIHVLGFAHNQDGDSFLMLPAVLNTNFWLATHVITISIGYALCLMTSVLAHLYLFLLAAGPRLSAHPKWGAMVPHISKTHLPGLHHLALLSLLFAAVGTVLGGIWADQSWGRFWGWDPKENGALLIVLWLVWVLHGRISSSLSALSYVAGLAYLSVIVALSWFGVNLLSVGLHAYGFTDSAAYMLGGIIILETSLIAALFIAARLQFHKNQSMT